MLFNFQSSLRSFLECLNIIANSFAFVNTFFKDFLSFFDGIFCHKNQLKSTKNCAERNLKRKVSDRSIHYYITPTKEEIH